MPAEGHGGNRDGKARDQHLVAAYALTVQAVLAQIRVDSNTNEFPAPGQFSGTNLRPAFQQVPVSRTTSW